MEKNCKPFSTSQLQEDRISKLPDDILVHILSSLKFKEAGQTSVLSRRWLNLWMDFPLLHFDQCRSHPKAPWKEDIPVFANWVNHVLRSRRSCNLREFRIFAHLDNSYQNEIDKWLEYVFETRLERLELNLSKCYGRCQLAYKHSYVFSTQLLNQTTQVGFSCLKALYFVAVNINGEAIQSFLLKCPLLEDLRVIGSKMLINLVVSGPSLSLKHLEITDCYPAESITISNTCIVSLKVSPRRKEGLLLFDLPFLNEVWINERVNKSILFPQMPGFFSQLTVLTIDVKEPKILRHYYKFRELQNLRRLVLVTLFCCDRSLMQLTSVIDSCPCLVEFALMLDHVNGVMLNEYQRKAIKLSLNRLKVFELYGYHGSKDESELIIFFIEKAVALEKIVIDPHAVDTRHYAAEPLENKRTEESRRHAIDNFEGAITQHIELVIL